MHIQCVKYKFVLFPSRVCLLSPSSYSFNHCRCLGTITLSSIFSPCIPLLFRQVTLISAWRSLRAILSERALPLFTGKKTYFSLRGNGWMRNRLANNSVWIFGTEYTAQQHTRCSAQCVHTRIYFLILDTRYCYTEYQLGVGKSRYAIDRWNYWFRITGLTGDTGGNPVDSRFDQVEGFLLRLGLW